MSKIAAALLAALAALAGAATASAAPFLPRQHAKYAALTYERAYWREQSPAPAITVLCKRRFSARKVGCEAQASTADRKVISVLTVTLLAHGVLRIHPVGFSLEAVLDE